MATYKNHMVLGSVEDNGDVNEMYPVTDAEDVIIKRNNGNIPSDVSNLQQLTDKMSAVAFNNEEDIIFAGNTMGTFQDPLSSEINDNKISKEYTWSSNKIKNTITDTTTKMQEYVRGKTESAVKAIPEKNSSEYIIDNTSPALPKVYSANVKEFSDQTLYARINEKARYIMQYFPYVDNDTGTVKYAYTRSVQMHDGTHDDNKIRIGNDFKYPK